MVKILTGNQFLWNKPFRPIPRAIVPQSKPGNPQIDPKMIIRPPWRGESKGQDVAHRHYPDLKFLPLRRGAPAPR
jgi:hypothetical protein